MKMRTIFIIFLFTLAPLANASPQRFKDTVATATPAKSPDCEVEATASSTIIARYMGLIEAGLSRQDLTIEDLRWVKSQLYPTNPRRGAKSPETTYLGRGFEKVIPLLRSEDWKILRTQIESKIHTLEKSLATVETAKEETASLYSWIRRPLRSHGRVQKFFVTKSGEVYVSMHDDKKTSIQEIFSGKTNSVPFHVGHVTQEDFFETSSGQVALALVVEKELKVVDARSGDILIELPFSQIDKVANPSKYGVHTYRPFLFENEGQLMAVLTPSAWGDKSEPLKVPVATINVTAKKVHRIKMLSRNLHYRRLKNGHVYGYGKIEPLANKDRPVQIFDVSKNLMVYASFYRGDSPDLTAMTPMLELDGSEYPQLFFRAGNEPIESYKFDRATQTLIPLEDLKQLSDAQQTTDGAGKSVIVGPVSDEQDIWHNSAYVVQPLDGTASRRIDLLGKKVSGKIGGIINGPQGELLLVFQALRPGSEAEIMHVLEMTTGHIESFPIGSSDVAMPFYNPRDGRIYAFRPSGVLNTSPWELYQLWGPTQ